MKKVFADADYLIALLNPKEQLHDAAKEASRRTGRVRTSTSEMVLSEVLAFYADRGQNLREAAARVTLQLKGDPNSTVVPQTSIQFNEALALYRNRADKGWSLTDCASFEIMRSEGITDAFTHDEHFVQAGFRALLRQE